MKNNYTIFKKLFLTSLLTQNLLTCAPAPHLPKKRPTRPSAPLLQRQTSQPPAQQITPAQPTLKGLIKVNAEWKNVPEFRIFFDGRQTINDKEGFYSFPIENKNVTKISILICKQLNQNFENINTIKNLSINPQNPYKLFSFKNTNTTDNIWQQKEKILESKNFIVPNNCIVILMNPKYVDKIENWYIKLTGNFVKLPQVILKDNFKEKRVHRQAAKSILRSFDLTAFHENVGKKTKKEDSKNVEVILTSAA